MLWFQSTRPGGRGNQDIWVSRRVPKSTFETATPVHILTSDDYEWTASVNAGPMVNASGDDNAPFLSANRISLYFRSVRSGSLGGADIWMSTRTAVAR